MSPSSRCLEDLRQIIRFARKRVRWPQARTCFHEGARILLRMNRRQRAANELFVFVHHRARKFSGGFSFVKENIKKIFVSFFVSFCRDHFFPYAAFGS